MKRLVYSLAIALAFIMASCSGTPDPKKVESIIENNLSAPGDISYDDADALISQYENACKRQAEIEDKAHGNDVEWSAEANNEYNNLENMKRSISTFFVLAKQNGNDDAFDRFIKKANSIYGF